MLRTILFAAAVWAMPLFLLAQQGEPRVTPLASYTDKEGEQQETASIDDGEAPLDVTFSANPENMEGHTVVYEWHFSKLTNEGSEELFPRSGEETSYTFNTSGTYQITLNAYVDGSDTPLDATPVKVVIIDSKLDFPNAFSPNGDGINDIYRAKEGWKSIVEFHAYIFNRWGQKLFEWTDPGQGWDGRHNGRDVPDGVYYVLVRAKGADGRHYNIKKDVNLLRGYIESTTVSQ